MDLAVYVAVVAVATRVLQCRASAKSRKADPLVDILHHEAVLAQQRIAGYVLRTPLLHSPRLEAATGGFIYCKLESEQVTGSFKARGAVNKLASLTAAERSRGVVTASTGNHALACAHALRALPQCADMPARIFLPRSVAETKLEALRVAQAPLCIVDADDCLASELAAIEAARSTGAIFISPYNDLQIAGGQGTIGLEIAEQLATAKGAHQKAGLKQSPRPLVVLVPVGGGGMIAGIAATLKHSSALPWPHCVVLGVQPRTNACMAHSIKAGGIVDEASADAVASDPTCGYVNGDTLSDGTAGGIEPGAFTFEACRNAAVEVADVASRIAQAKEALAAIHAGDAAGASTVAAAARERLVDGMLLVEEDDIAAGVLYMLNVHHKVVEGSAGSAIAAVQRFGNSVLHGCDVVAVCCGSNIATAKLAHLLQKGQ